MREGRYTTAHVAMRAQRAFVHVLIAQCSRFPQSPLLLGGITTRIARELRNNEYKCTIKNSEK